MMETYLRIILLLASLILCGGSSLALAQTETPDSTTQEILTESETWFSVSSSLHYFVPSFEMHLGFEDALSDNLDLRVTLSTFIIDGGGFIAGGLNGMKTMDNNINRKSYMGFGPRMLHIFSPNYSDDIYEPSSYSQTFLGVGGFWGVEWFPQSSSRPFTEFNLSLPLFNIMNDTGNVTSSLGPMVPIFSISAGYNFYF